MKYIVLYNPHDGRWKLFEYIEGKEKYAPNYGCPIVDGATPGEALAAAVNMFGIDPDEVEV